jgi:para-nitrobenzyl esterase
MSRSLLKTLTVAAAGLLLLAATASGAQARGPDLVRTDAGLLRGTVTESSRAFQGIPYAAPPVGERRWRAPEPAAPWSGVRDATAPGSPCAQPRVESGEDCLFLNVHTPAPARKRMPVMVFVHGGGLNTQHGAMYDPTRIVERSDVVVVTLNYRLGALGFLAHPDMSDPFAGNFGLADQQAALEWVRDNVDAFGGDPGNVTLWGQSAGGRTACAQLAAPGAAGLFHKAIMQSAPCGNPVLTVDEAERRGLAHAAELGCDTASDSLACLRGADVADLVALGLDGYRSLHRRAADLPWSPVAGTEALPLQPLTALRRGLAADVPLLHGGTSDEMRSIVYGLHDGAQRPVTAEAYPRIVEDLFGPDAPAVLERYPMSGHPTPSLALATLLTDYGGQIGICSQAPALNAAARHMPVYAYEFAEPSPPQGAFPLGAHHSADLRYLFDVPYWEAPTGEQLALSETMIDHWTRFARTGDPGGDWSAYRHRNAYSMAVERTGMVDVARGHHCGFWAAHA